MLLHPPSLPFCPLSKQPLLTPLDVGQIQTWRVLEMAQVSSGNTAGGFPLIPALAQDFRSSQKSFPSALYYPKLYPPRVTCELEAVMCECEILSHSSCSQIIPCWEEMELQRVENRFVVKKDAKLQLCPFQLCSLLMGRAIPTSTSSPRVPRLFMTPPPRCKDKEEQKNNLQKAVPQQLLSQSL